jgi:Cyclin-dependent kinase regulatory subunit
MIPKQFYEDPQRPEVLRLLREDEWRGIGITQSLGWEHYEVHGEPVLAAISLAACSLTAPRTISY